jgi:hypothetical protein
MQSKCDSALLVGTGYSALSVNYVVVPGQVVTEGEQDANPSPHTADCLI